MQAYKKCWFEYIFRLSISISWKVLTEDAEFVGFFKMLLMKWHENKSCLIRFDCSHIENQGRKIINFFGISRIQIRTKIRLDHKDLSWTTFWWLDADFGFFKFQDFRYVHNLKILKFRTYVKFHIIESFQVNNHVSKLTLTSNFA